MKCKQLLSAFAVAMALLAAPASADLVDYSQDFQGLTQSDANALANDGWFYFVNAFGDPNYGYGGTAPNSFAGGQISSIADDGSGNQYLNVYSDYANGDLQAGTHALETNVYQQQTIGAANLGQTWEYTFDTREGDQPFDPSGQTTTSAFIKVFSPGFASLELFEQFDTTSAGFTFGPGSLSMEVQAGWTDYIVQFGALSNVADAADGAGVYYDNVTFQNAAAGIPEPGSAILIGLGMGLVAMRRRR